MGFGDGLQSFHRENGLLLRLEAPGISCGRVGSPGDSWWSRADPLGFVVLPGKLGCPVDSGSWCLIWGNWISRRFLENQAETLGCVVQPGKLGFPWIQAFGVGGWDLQEIPRGAGQIFWDVLCREAHFSQDFIASEGGKWKTT